MSEDSHPDLDHSPHLQSLKGIGASHIVALFKEQALPPPIAQSIKRINLGFNNLSFAVDTAEKSYVLRVTQNTWPKRKIQCERDALSMVRAKSSIPVPNVVACTEGMEASSEALEGHSFMLMDKMEGDLLHEVWKTMTLNQRRDVMRDVAQILAQMQQMKFSSMGCFARYSTSSQKRENTNETGERNEFVVVPHWEGDKGPFNSTAEWLDSLWINCQKDHAMHMQALEALSPFKSRIDDAIQLVIHEEKEAEKEEFVLSHGDLNFRNMLYKDGKISALVDWEWAASFPYEHDFADGFEEIREANLIEEFYQIAREEDTSIRLPVNDRRSKRRDWASGLAYDFAPWWIVCPMTTKEKKERVAETARILETKLANPP